MKKLFPILFIFFSIGALSAQNLNFKDTNRLKTLLCSHAWYRYSVNPDSAFSDRVMDSIKFYKNGTFYKSERPKDDTVVKFLPSEIITGAWHFGSTGKILLSDSASNYILIVIDWTKGRIIDEDNFELIDGHRIKGTTFWKKSGNLDQSFLGYRQYLYAHYDILQVWQPRREFKKAKKH